MAYRADIPAQGNIVRTASGDLSLMRGNFVALSGVATLGLDGLSGIQASGRVEGDLVQFRNGAWGRTDVTADGALAAGDLMRWRVAGGADRWVASGLPLDDLSNVSGAGAANNGQALVFRAADSRWIPGNVAAAGGGDTTTSGFVLVSFAQMQLSGVVSGSGPYTVTGFDASTALASGVTASWTVSAASGILVVPSGVDVIRVRGRAHWTGINSNNTVELLKDGVPLPFVSRDAGRDVVALGAIGFMQDAYSAFVPVSGGEEITMRAESSAADLPLQTSGTWLMAEAYQLSGIGGGGGGVFRQASLRMPSGTTQSFTNNNQAVVTGMEVMQNVGSFATLAASGIIEVPSGITHIQVFGAVRWQANGTGDRRAGIFFDGVNVVSGGGLRALAIQPVVAAGTTPHFVTLTTPLLDAIPGQQIQLTGRQGSGGLLDAEWGSAGGGGAEHDTYLVVRGYNLTDG